jgi:hypothetical protein
MSDALRPQLDDKAGVTELATPLSAVLRAADSMASSTEPEVVFGSLVQVCAPLVSDAATATVARADGTSYATSWANSALQHRAQPDSVITDFAAPSIGGYDAYHGLVSFRFRLQDASRPFIAQLLVERAMANVERERLGEAVTSQRAVVEHLELALSTNREIGIAIGILMATHKITDAQAFDLLSRVSQRSNRKLRVIALEVARTGVLELPAVVAAVQPDKRKRRRLEVVPTPGARERPGRE